MEPLVSILGRVVSGVGRWQELRLHGFAYDGAGIWHRGQSHVSETLMFRMSPAQWEHWINSLSRWPEAVDDEQP